jgi:hypothetical protein
LRDITDLKKAGAAGSTARGRAIFPLALSLLFFIGSAMADDDSIQSRFNRKYQDFLTQSSQSLLPLPKISVPDWKKMLETGALKKIYVDPDRFYSNKIYTFTMYQAEDGGSYYLDAKGGFWGMDELVYGPINAVDLQ